MAQAKSTSTSETSTKAQRETAGAAQHDVVAVPSLRKDGSPDQEPGFEQLVEEKPGDRLGGARSVRADATARGTSSRETR